MNPSFENGQESTKRTAAGVPSVDAGHIPFRAWALQRDFGSVLGRGSEPTWGLRPDGSDDVLEPSDRSGQAFLREAIAPNPEYRLRARTGTLLLALALIVNVLSLLNPLAIRVASAGASRACILISVVALAAALMFFRRIPHRWFNYFEQMLLVLMSAVVAIHVFGTGDARSPYLIWTMTMLIYSAYFQPRNWVVLNTTVATALVLTPLIFTTDRAGGYEIVVTVLLIAVIWAIALSISRSRNLARRASSAVDFLALGDPLTGVANRRAYNRFAAEVAGRGDSFALVVFDLRGLRGANTVFGYDVGDEMLVALARVLCSACGEFDQVARIGGDEFAVLMPGADAEAAELMLQRFDEARNAYNARVQSRSPRISVYAGTATFPNDGSTPDAVRGVADSRMLVQKTHAVPPVWEIDETSARIGKSLLPGADPPLTPYHEPGTYAAAYWLLLAISFSLWLVLPDGAVPHPTATFFLMLGAFVISVVLFWGRDIFYSITIRNIADVAAIGTIAPGMWITGGWSSPLQPAVILVVAFFAQFFRGTEALARIGAAIGMYALAFWTSGAVSDTGQALFNATFMVAMTVGAVLFANGRAFDAAQDVVRQAATRDPLTGVPNVYAFRADLETLIMRAREHPAADSGHPALLIADVDDFHAVNLAGGHRAGDDALAEVAKRLDDVTGDEQSIYRIGGDEFAILGTLNGPAEATELADRCRRALSFTPANAAEPITCSVGYSTWSHDMSAEQLVDSVETALAAITGERSKSVAGKTSIWI